MSNDSSASETTPLRRPEEESYRHLPVDEDSLTASVTTKLLTSRNGLPVASTSHNGVRSNARFNTIAVAHHGNSSNNNTNHNIEVHLTAASDQLRHRSPLDSNHSPFAPTPNVNYLNKMDTTNKRILCRIGLDVLILICGKCQLTYSDFQHTFIDLHAWRRGEKSDKNKSQTNDKIMSIINKKLKRM